MSQHEKPVWDGRMFVSSQSAQINFTAGSNRAPFVLLNPVGSGVDCAIIAACVSFSSQQPAGQQLPPGAIGLYGTTSTGRNAVTNGVPPPVTSNLIGRVGGETPKAQTFYAPSNAQAPVIQATAFPLIPITTVNRESSNTATEPKIIHHDFSGMFVLAPGALIFFAFNPPPPAPPPNHFLTFGLVWEEVPIQTPCVEAAEQKFELAL